MRKHWLYLCYVVKHKWFVLLAGLHLQSRGWDELSLRQLILHDWSKFRPSEWLPYAEWFNGFRGGSWYEAPATLGKYVRKADFDRAWLFHQRRNLHHWQAWVLREDDGGTVPLEMPLCFVLEMIADWRGAGRAITGRDDVEEWYHRTKSGRLLHPKTLHIVETILGISEPTEHG